MLYFFLGNFLYKATTLLGFFSRPIISVYKVALSKLGAASSGSSGRRWRKREREKKGKLLDYLLLDVVESVTSIRTRLPIHFTPRWETCNTHTTSSSSFSSLFSLSTRCCARLWEKNISFFHLPISYIVGFYFRFSPLLFSLSLHLKRSRETKRLFFNSRELVFWPRCVTRCHRESIGPSSSSSMLPLYIPYTDAAV